MISISISVSYAASNCLCCILQYACDVQAEVVGKPSKTFFNTALQDMNVRPENVSIGHAIGISIDTTRIMD